MGISNITGEDHHANLSSANSVENQLQQVEQNNNNQHQLLNHFLYGSPNGDQTNSHGSSNSLYHHQQRVKKKRNLPGTPDPNAEVIALSPTTLMARNRFVCEICNKGFQRDQNLQLHRRGHNLPWKLRQRTGAEVKKRVYVCPEPTCVHHNPARALGDLTGIKKHFSRKHGEKKWKCEKCSKKYAVQSDLKAHQKTCGTREYKCDCGTLFSRRDSFITHRAFCNALTEENNKLKQGTLNNNNNNIEPISIISSPKLPHFGTSIIPELFNPYDKKNPFKSLPQELNNSTPPFPAPATGAPGGLFMAGPRSSNNSSSFSSLKLSSTTSSRFSCLYDSKNSCLQDSGLATTALVTSATALLQKAAQIGATTSSVGVLKSPLLEMPHSDQPDMVGMNMEMYGHMMMMKEQDNCTSNSSSFVVHEKGQWQPISRFSSGDNNSKESQMMTLDLLGERGWRLRQLQGNESHHHEEMMPIMKHFEMQNFHKDSNVDKSIFEF
ncbi:zinc finger protein GAI-ASSOCIATED FACTOR 1-like [Benincasa hispida]|uniref:zinc finger protein GAI-ASSOCIATED FACTOR 1-like n=1 Tax=Benincasa hispida TaxID=102211 RepID=UPI0018FFAA1E|nr:zinc finger protein GAI-ASSOCIATED FACTOR 1-like [Benincasa hispida]